MRRGSSSSQRPSAAKEKARRDRMKDLYSTLATLLQLQPHVHLLLSLKALKQRKEQVEWLRSIKKELEESLNGKSSNNNIHKIQQFVQVREVVESKLEANLKIMVNNKNVTPSHILRVIEEGVLKLRALISCHMATHLRTIHLHRASICCVGFELITIESRLLELVY
ncbi:hypothetical protein Tco_0018964 [Tanacetum coccineum]